VRKSMGLLTAAVWFGMACQAWAQQPALFTGAFNPRPIVNQPIDTTKALRAPSPFQTTSSFNPLRFFPSFHFPSQPTSIGSSALPPPSSFPSTQYPNFKPVPFKPANNLAPRFVPTNNRPNVSQ
jgi:hypothetical protein